MPIVVSRSDIRVPTEQLSLSLCIQHHIVAGSEEVPAIVTDKRFPKGVDVTLSSKFHLSFTGRVNKRVVSSNALKTSAILDCFLAYMRLNSSQLGINDKISTESSGAADVKGGVKDMFSIEQFFTDILVYIQSAYVHPPAPAQLLVMKLFLSWKTNDDSYDPFSDQLLLPAKQILDDVIEKWASTHLVRRYPYIFGPWRRKLDQEATIFPIFARSLTNIFLRTPNPRLRKHFRTNLDRISAAADIEIAQMHDTLAELVGVGNTQGCIAYCKKDAGDEEEVICNGMRRLFCQNVKPHPFKGIGVDEGKAVDATSFEIHDSAPASKEALPEDETTEELWEMEHQDTLLGDSYGFDLEDFSQDQFPFDDNDLELVQFPQTIHLAEKHTTPHTNEHEDCFTLLPEPDILLLGDESRVSFPSAQTIMTIPTRLPSMVFNEVAPELGYHPLQDHSTEFGMVPRILHHPTHMIELDESIVQHEGSSPALYVESEASLVGASTQEVLEVDLFSDNDVFIPSNDFKKTFTRANNWHANSCSAHLFTPLDDNAYDDAYIYQGDL